MCNYCNFDCVLITMRYAIMTFTTKVTRTHTSITRHRASRSMYSLTFRVRVTTPQQYVRNGTASLQVRRFYHRRGESSPACVVCVCGMHAACGGPGGLPLDSATHFHSVAIATQPVHRLQIRQNSAQLGGIPYHSPKLHPGPCNSAGMRPRTGRHTDARHHNTFRVVYDSREM